MERGARTTEGAILMSRRRGFEFDRRTRDRAIEKWHHANPGNEDEELEVDHKVPIWFAKKHRLPSAVIRSQQNAEALPKSDHKEKHRNESEEEYWSIWQGMIGFINRLL